MDMKERCQGCKYEEIITAHDGYRFANCSHYNKAVWEVKECNIRGKDELLKEKRKDKMDKKNMDMTCKEGFKEAFERYLKDVNREGISDLIEWLDKTGFYEAPASGSYHLAKEGGLVEHSLNVVNLAMDLNRHMGQPVEEESVIIAAALHDLGKHQYHNKSYYTENILKSGNRSTAKPWERNKDLINVPHEIISIQVASRFIDLTEEETWAILHHNGLYGDLKYNLMGKESKLQMLVHFADMWASRVVEVED